MTNRELSAEVKKELKTAGFELRSFCVSVRDIGYSTKITVKILSPQISVESVRKLLRHHEDYELDKRTGEILQGGNTYLFIDYEHGIFDQISQEWAATARSAFESKEETTRIFDGLYLINWEHSGKLTLRQQNNKYFGSIIINDFNELCKYIYKFVTFGNIAA